MIHGTNSKRLLASSIAVIMTLAIVPSNAFADNSSTEISLIIDCSGSITSVPADFDTMLDGYVQAFNDPALQAVMSAGSGTSVEVIFFSSSSGVVIPHTHIHNPAEAIAFATTLDGFKFVNNGPPGFCGLATSPGPAIVLATNNFGAHPGNRQVIDVSTDGQFAAVPAAIATAQAGGVDTLNALGFGGGVVLANLQGLIFGPGSFASIVPNVQAFVIAVQSKLFQELSAVGGEILSIDTTALLVAGTFANAIWILPMLGVIAGTGAYFTRSKWLYSKE